MSTRDDGGPAFPQRVPLHPALPGQVGGMTLRDYFAAKAMHAHLITDTVPGEACDALLEAAARAGQDPIYRIALNAYEVADAMLKARQK